MFTHLQISLSKAEVLSFIWDRYIIFLQRLGELRLQKLKGLLIHTCKVKVKLSRYRPGGALGVPEGWVNTHLCHPKSLSSYRYLTLILLKRSLLDEGRYNNNKIILIIIITILVQFLQFTRPAQTLRQTKTTLKQILSEPKLDISGWSF